MPDRVTHSVTASVACCLVWLAVSAGAAEHARPAFDWDAMVTSEDGRRTFHCRPIDPELVNPWPQELVEEFQRTADRIFRAQSNVSAGANTYFEHEKRDCGFLEARSLDFSGMMPRTNWGSSPTASHTMGRSIERGSMDRPRPLQALSLHAGAAGSWKSGRTTPSSAAPSMRTDELTFRIHSRTLPC